MEDSFIIVETFQVLLASKAVKSYIYKKRMDELKHKALVLTIKPTFWKRKKEFSRAEYITNMQYLWHETQNEFWHIGMQFWLDTINRLISACEMSAMQHMFLSTKDAEALKDFWI